MRSRRLLVPLVMFSCTLSAVAGPRLRVAENRRFLIYDDGRPFFYPGDTAWELFHRLNREDTERYLRNRARRACD